MSLLRIVAIAAALLGGAPAFAQAGLGVTGQPVDTITITATQKSGRPTLMGYFVRNPLPDTADALITRLNRPDTCGKEAWPTGKTSKPCAIIVYYLADRGETAHTPLLVFRAIYFVTHPDNPANTTLQILDLNGEVKLFSGKNLEEPLRAMRVPNSCHYVWDMTRDDNGLKVKKCQRVSVLYQPIGILGYIENDQQKILTGEGKDMFFHTAVFDHEADGLTP